MWQKVVVNFCMTFATNLLMRFSVVEKSSFMKLFLCESDIMVSIWTVTLIKKPLVWGEQKRLG
jgi:hypothetical protein